MAGGISNSTDIAIVGMAIRVPGAATPEKFWANLAAGVESVEHYTDADLVARGVSPGLLAHPNYVRAGIPLQGFDQFDPEFFGFSPKEGAIIDPQHRHFYEVAWEALERAGHPPSSFDGSIGVFAGCGMNAYFTFNLLTNTELLETVGLFLLRHTGNDKDFLATRASYAFNLKGPSVNVQTACSTSLVATHLAVQSLLTEECDMALAGGVTIEIPHGVGYLYREGEVLSPDGHCHAFDHRSKGTVFGSGAGVVVLRRLADAVADGDHIHAVIKGTAINNDGSRKVGYLAPSVDGQAAAIAEALAVADVPASTITYVECHGTATPIGDPIEIAALTLAFRASGATADGYCRVGSVKTNIGHLDTAAGVASLIKAALALEHKRIPPSLNFEKPNPNIDFANSPFIVATELSEWEPGATRRRAAVNSLGVGGTNAFVVLEEAPAEHPARANAKPQLLMLSARHRASIDNASMSLAAWLRAHSGQPLADIAYTLHVGREMFEQRRIVVASSHEEAAGLLEAGDAQRVFTHRVEKEHPSLVFMYPGGGAQYFRMGSGLYEAEPLFREHVDRGLALLKSRCGTDLSQFLLGAPEQRDEATRLLARPAIQLPLTFLVEYALTKLWEQYGLRPESVIGHSMGENTAACIAGVFSFEDTLGLLLLRGQLVEEAPAGGMLSVPLCANELREIIGDKLDIAAANSPQLSVASGPSHEIEALAAKLATMNIDARRVSVSVAAHSRLLNGVLERFRAYLQRIRLSPPNLEIISNRTGGRLDATAAVDPEYWVQHLRNTVRFDDGITTLLEGPERVFLEVGPGNMLSSFARQNPRISGQRVFASMRHPDDPVADEVYFRTTIGRLWAIGVPVSPQKLYPARRRRVPLPTYSFQHARYWVDRSRETALDGEAVLRPLRLAEPSDWYHEIRWIQQGILETDFEPKTWLVFQDREPLSEALVSRLRTAGHRVIAVQAGDTFARLDDSSYALAPEAGGAGYQNLIDALLERDQIPDRVLHTWLVTWDRKFRPGQTFFHRNQERGFYSLFYLARAWGKAMLADRPLHIVVLGNGTLSVAGERPLHPDKSTVLGPCLVIPRELSSTSCKFVDIGVEATTQERGRKPPVASPTASVALIDALEIELAAPAQTETVAWRTGVRWRRHVVALRNGRERSPPAQRLRQKGVYTVTGGLGGIGGEVAAWLAERYAARLLLIARTPLPKREDWDDWLRGHPAEDSISHSIVKVRRLESLGGTVLPLAADVSVAEQLRDAIAEGRRTFGEINGVFHAAGVVRDGLIQLKSPRDIEDVMAAKVYGTVMLDEIFRDSPLDFMILFASTSSLVAPQGQIDYVGANSFVNSFAESCHGARRYPVTAINWGIWRDVGFAAMIDVHAATAAATADADVAHGSMTLIEHPLFHRRYASRDGVAQLHVIEGTLASDHWLIDEHRLGTGEALLPGTGYIEVIRAALAEIGDRGPWEMANLLFRSPLFVRDKERRPIRVRLVGDDRRWEIAVLAKSRADTSADPWELYATATVSHNLGTRPPASRAAIDAAALEGTKTAAAGNAALRMRQEDHLRLGPRWQVLKTVTIGRSEALAELSLPNEYACELPVFLLHPALLDAATGYAMDLIPGYAAQEVPQDLWVPLSYRRIIFHAPLTGSVVSRVKINDESSIDHGFASFDVQVFDTSGALLVDIADLTLRRADKAMRDSGSNEAASHMRVDGRQRAKPTSPAEAALHYNVTQGIGTREGLAALERILAGSMPATVVVSSMGIDALATQATAITQLASRTDETRFARPELASNFEPPRDAVEQELAALWGKLLGVEGIGIRDSFFDLGGHSLIAVRLFNAIVDRYKLDLPMSVLLQAPTIAGLAERIRGNEPLNDASAVAAPVNAASATQLRHVVSMRAGSVGAGTPLFMVAGMFGNVLNLSHLANLLGDDRPFLALQARGLYGDSEPHETFEEMATDYIAELRQVQPHGPYLLGGFSGGGLVAFEMAQQLIAAGEEIITVLLLDTPARKLWRLSFGDRLSMMLQGLRTEGWRFAAQKLRNRAAWKRQQSESRAQAAAQAREGGVTFQSQRIGAAFIRALARYVVRRVAVPAAVFRPKLDVRFKLSDGRMIDSKRDLVAPDNGWTPFVERLDVYEVPGNHDSMVLEPNVRVVVALMRRAIAAAEDKAR